MANGVNSMKTTFCFHLFIWSIITLLTVSCSKQNDALVLRTTGGFQEDMAVYPHPVAWGNKHMGYMADNKVESSCLQCHQSQLGKPLVVSCATQCHRSESENIPAKEAPTPVANKCTTCHADVTKNKYGHYPVNAGVCTTCHTVSDKHLAGEKDSATIKDTANDCYRCHTRKDTEANVHTALTSETSCVTCHDPHGGNQRFFLRDFSKNKDVTVKALCTQCHSFDIGENTVKHGAVEDPRSCLNCHNPHSSKNSKQLKQPVKEMCLSCHDRPIQATLSDSRIIPNIKAKVDSAKKTMGSCTDCHNAHGTNFNRILVENYSISNYNEYPPAENAPNPYALCIRCHSDGLLNKDEVESTNFRTPVKNLHWKHVVEEKPGKSCKICHDPHGSKQDAFINETWSMNGEPIMIKYTKTETGGNCTFTCHDLRTYDRQ